MILHKLHLNLLNKKLISTFPLHSRVIHLNSVNQNRLVKWCKEFWKSEMGPNPLPYTHCTQIGDPVLRQVAPEVPPDHVKDKEIKLLVEHMKTVLRDYNLVGLAAPQIGVSVRIFCMEFREDAKKKYPPEVYKNRQMETFPMTTFINPVIKVKNFNKKIFPEGCASVCGYIGDVARYEEVLVSGFNEHGDPTELHLKGWNARIAQHELDHLNGRVFVDIMDTKTFTCATWEAVNAHSGQLSIPFYPAKSLFSKGITK